MNTIEISKKWRRLDAIPFTEIGKSRNYAHEAIQFLASTGLTYVQKKEDDSHTNCEWSRSLKAFVGNVFGEKNKICLGLNISDFKLLLLKENWTIIDEFPLKDKNLDDVLKWLRNNFEHQGLDPNQFTLKKHYEIPFKTVFEGGIFKVENKQAFQELSDYFSNADLVLRAYIGELTNATPVRCWPHHFDIATLLNIGMDKLQSIGIGLSPGGSGKNEPYFYVTMWPYPDSNTVKFPDLMIGNWNVKGWFGAYLSASEIIKKTNEEEQYKMVYNFIENSVQKIKESLV
jgi:hypothetical protein